MFKNDDQSVRCMLVLKTDNSAYDRVKMSARPIEITNSFLIAFDLNHKEVV